MNGFRSKRHKYGNIVTSCQGSLGDMYVILCSAFFMNIMSGVEVVLFALGSVTQCAEVSCL